MKRIFVCSPLRARDSRSEQDMRRLGLELCHRVLSEGHAPFAPHALYPLVLSDADPQERRLALRAAQAWLFACDEVWVYTRHGVSEGMEATIRLARHLGKPVVLRGDWSRVPVPVPSEAEVRARG